MQHPDRRNISIGGLLVMSSVYEPLDNHHRGSASGLPIAFDTNIEGVTTKPVNSSRMKTQWVKSVEGAQSPRKSPLYRKRNEQISKIC